MVDKNFVLDSFAWLAFLQDGPGAAKVEEILNAAQTGINKLWIHRVNWGEIYYTISRRKGNKAAEQALDQLALAPLIIIDTCDHSFVKAVATIKAKYRLSYADAFAIQLALDLKAQLVTGDSEIKAVSQKESRLNLVWLGK